MTMAASNAQRATFKGVTRSGEKGKTETIKWRDKGGATKWDGLDGGCPTPCGKLPRPGIPAFQADAVDEPLSNRFGKPKAKKASAISFRMAGSSMVAGV